MQNNEEQNNLPIPVKEVLNKHNNLPRENHNPEIMPTLAASIGDGASHAGIGLDQTLAARPEAIADKSRQVAAIEDEAARIANFAAQRREAGMLAYLAGITNSRKTSSNRDDVAAVTKMIFEAGMNEYPSYTVGLTGNGGFTKGELRDHLSTMLKEGMDADAIVSLFVSDMRDKRGTFAKDKAQFWPAETKGLLQRGLSDFGHIANAGKPFVAGGGDKQKCDKAAWPQVAGLEQVFYSLSREGTVQNAIRTVDVWDNTPLDPPVWQSDFEIVRQLTPAEVAIFNPLRDQYLAAYEVTRKTNGKS